MKLVLYLLLLSIATGITFLWQFDNTAHAYEPEMVVHQVDNTETFLRIKVVTYSSKEEVNQAYRDHLASRGHDISDVNIVNGWARWSNETTQFCVIHVVEPLTTYDQVFRTWGHELGHCVYGSFHE